MQRVLETVIILAIGVLSPSLLAQPPALPTGSTGIAASFPNDTNIQSHANVLFADGFETYSSASALVGSGNWTNYYQASYVAVDSSVFYGGTKSIRLRVPTTTTGFGDAIVKRLPVEQDILFMRVYARYQANYAGLAEAHNGLTISGRYPGPGTRPNGTDFFLVLIEDSRYLGEGEPGYTNAYVYHPEQDDLYGEHWYPDGFVSNGTQNFGPYFVVRPKVIPARGTWICYEVMIKLNTPGSRDGRVAVWQNGALIADWQNLRFRDVSTLKIDQIELGNGGKSSSQQNDKWYDNLVLATSYIGPMSTTADTIAPSVPTGLSATAASSSQINLSWNASTDNVGVTGYDIYRGGSLLTSVTGTTYVNTGLSPNTSYSYTVRAKDAAGNTSAQSASATAITQGGSLTMYTLSVLVSGSGTVTGTGINCGSDCSETLSSGTQVALSASPNPGFTFAGWSGGGCGGIGSCTVTLSANTSVTANFTASSSGGRTITAASCNRNDVQTAVSQHLANPADGDIISIPAGTCTWTASISATVTRNLTIQGAGAISATDGGASTTGSDVTTILDNHPTTGHNLFSFNVANGKTVRITGLKIAMNGASTTTQNGVISISGGSNSLRIDHCHFVINPDSSMTIAVYGGVTGVIDHNYFDSELGNGPFAVYLQNGVGTGDAAWSAPDDFGTDKFIFLEDNRWRNGYLGDANTGGQRFVYRYNTAVMQGDDTTKTMGYVANHGLTSGRNRSSRAFEFYGNTLSAKSPGLNKSPFPINGGTGLVWGNTVSQYRFVTSLGYTRQNNVTYPYGSTPSGWGNCNGSTGTVWDGSGGYPCLDQPGRGKGDLLSGAFPNVINSRTANAAFVQQALSPIYVWGNTLTPAGYSPVNIVDVSAPSAIVKANREYYQQFGAYGESGSFDGTRGVGQGPLSARPTTCTAGPGGNTPGVGYWATDQQTLYVCTATNSWSAYYTPYTYPHPLAASTQRGTSALAPPTNLLTTVR